MNRRKFLSCLTITGGAAAVVTSTVAVPLLATEVSESVENYSSEVNRWAEEIDKYVSRLEELKFKRPEPAQLPFATIPVNMYGRAPKVTAPTPDIGDLVKGLKTCSYHQDEMYTKINHLTELLWHRWRPNEKRMLQVPDAEPIVVKGKPVPVARISTPRYVVDVDEMNECSLANTFGTLKDLAIEMRQKLHQCEEEAKKVNNGPVLSMLKYAPAKVHMNREAYILEFFFWTNYTGVSWPI